MKKTVIVDYESGNLFSVFHACRILGLDPLITNDVREILNADGVILPGVGAFGDAMQHLQNLGMVEAIKECINNKKPFLGICLGMQLLFEESEEFGAHKGFGLVKGKVKKFKFDNSAIKVPHVGWSRLMKPEGVSWTSSLLKEVKEGEFMYFVHSYYVEPSDPDIVLVMSDYEGQQFCSAIMKKNIFATQFHPEKSGRAGMTILKEFAALIRNGK